MRIRIKHRIYFLTFLLLLVQLFCAGNCSASEIAKNESGEDENSSGSSSDIPHLGEKGQDLSGVIDQEEKEAEEDVELPVEMIQLVETAVAHTKVMDDSEEESATSTPADSIGDIPYSSNEESFKDEDEDENQGTNAAEDGDHTTTTTMDIEREVTTESAEYPDQETTTMDHPDDSAANTEAEFALNEGESATTITTTSHPLSSNVEQLGNENDKVKMENAAVISTQAETEEDELLETTTLTSNITTITTTALPTEVTRKDTTAMPTSTPTTTTIETTMISTTTTTATTTTTSSTTTLGLDYYENIDYYNDLDSDEISRAPQTLEEILAGILARQGRGDQDPEVPAVVRVTVVEPLPVVDGKPILFEDGGKLIDESAVQTLEELSNVVQFDVTTNEEQLDIDDNNNNNNAVVTSETLHGNIQNENNSFQVSPERPCISRFSLTSFGLDNKYLGSAAAESDLEEGTDNCMYIIQRSAPSICAVNIECHTLELSEDCEKEFWQIDGERLCGNLTGKMREVQFRGDNIILSMFSSSGNFRAFYNVTVRQLDCVEHEEDDYAIVEELTEEELEDVLDSYGVNGGGGGELLDSYGVNGGGGGELPTGGEEVIIDVGRFEWEIYIFF